MDFLKRIASYVLSKMDSQRDRLDQHYITLRDKINGTSK